MRVLLAMLLAAGLCGEAEAGAAATAKLIDLERNVVGHADFRATTHGVLIEIAVNGLPPGPHAVLLHSTAACDPGTQFTSAGPVFSFDSERPHGYLAKGGPRAGDLPMQFAAADGTLHASIATTAITLGNGAKSIFDRDGVSIIVHANGDDYLSQPDGRAGPRLACGTIIRTVAPGPQKRAKKHK
jgi:Cu-Zn family superoxide dismutase